MVASVTRQLLERQECERVMESALSLVLQNPSPQQYPFVSHWPNLSHRIVSVYKNV